MPVNLQCFNSPLNRSEIRKLWQHTIKLQKNDDVLVNVRCVNEDEIQSLNERYRGKNKPTNILTFSYGDGEYDISVCIKVAHREAKEIDCDTKDYFALLLTHAFLHVTGLDHEKSKQAEEEMKEKEDTILEKAGYQARWK